jgi:inosine-uridine nucleoside N-ribohydrolase
LILIFLRIHSFHLHSSALFVIQVPLSHYYKSSIGKIKKNNHKRVWLDTDPGIGVSFRDIDDGLAIMYLLSSEEISLEGISIIFGNVKAEKGYEVAKAVLKVTGFDIPVFQGASSKKDLGTSLLAAKEMVKFVNENPGEISLLTIGPLTNVATAMMIDKDFSKNLKELIVMGGSFNVKPFSFFGEFNFHLDGRATKTVMDAPIKKTLLTMDVCVQAIFNDEHLARIKANDSEVSRYLAETIPSWLNINKFVIRKGGFFPWDPVAVTYLIDDDFFDNNPCVFDIQETGIRSGRIIGPEFVEDFEERDGRIPVNIPRKINADLFMEHFLNGLLSL